MLKKKPTNSRGKWKFEEKKNLIQNISGLEHADVNLENAVKNYHRKPSNFATGSLDTSQR